MATKTPFRLFTNDSGRTFTVRLLPAGARFGKTNSLINEDALTVEFYDTMHADDGTNGEDGHGPLGQFVSRYRVATLFGRDGYGSKVEGLNLHGGVDVWSIDTTTMSDILEWLTSFDEAEQRYEVFATLATQNSVDHVAQNGVDQAVHQVLILGVDEEDADAWAARYRATHPDV